jgi:hypothetical protein
MLQGEAYFLGECIITNALIDLRAEVNFHA